MLENIPLHMTLLTTDEAIGKWDLIHKHIEHSLDFSPDIEISDVKVAIEKGTYKVIEVERNNDIVGIVVVKFQQVKDNVIAFILAMGGNWICHKNSIIEFKNYLKTFGATKLQGIARPSVERMWKSLGVTSLYTVMETTI